MRGSSPRTCCACANFGLSASSSIAAVVPPTAKRAAPSRKPRRSMPPCTYWSNRRSTSGAKSAAVGRARSGALGSVIVGLLMGQPHCDPPGPTPRASGSSRKTPMGDGRGDTQNWPDHLTARGRCDPMKITSARVIVCCPGRNFVTLKIETDAGLTGLGDATLNGRELAVASYLDRPRDPVPDRPRRASDRGHLAVPLPRRVLAARAGDDERDRRGRHRVVGPEGQGRRAAAVPAARRREPHRRDGLRPCERARHRADRRRGAALQGRRLPRDPRAERRARPREGLRRRPRHDLLRAGRRRPAERTRLVDREVPAATRRSCSTRCARRSAPTCTCCTTCTTASRRSRPRGSARTWSRIASSGWKTRRRPRTRRPSA